MPAAPPAGEADAKEFKGSACLALAGFSLDAARRVGSEDSQKTAQGPVFNFSFKGYCGRINQNRSVYASLL